MKINQWWRNGRLAGSGGGGVDAKGGVTPYFCKRCGRTVPAKKVMSSCDVCAKCRATR